jgi:glycosyltransferase involved in cell wall biosynthesis
MVRLAAARGSVAPRPPRGVRVVIDARPLQEPENAPITAGYLEQLLEAFARRPLAGESFVPLVRTLRADPTEALEARGLEVVARRRLPPTTRAFRSAGLTLDSFLLRGAELASGRGARAAGAAGVVYHTAGGAVPLASRLPVVATLLDLAPWELPERYARSTAARFGHRLRARVLHDAARVIVASRATAESACRLLHLHEERLRVVPLAPDAAFTSMYDRGAGATLADLRARYDLPERYLVFSGRYDARKDVATLFSALGALASADGRAGGPVVVLAGAAGEDHADSPVVARLARRAGVDDVVRLTPRLVPSELAALEWGAEALVLPVLSEGTGLAALEALAVGIPVICSRVGPLPEIVGAAGIVVEPRSAERLAAAIQAVWDGGAVARQLRRAAVARASGTQRTWDDVALETRRVYEEAVEPDARAGER